MAETTENTRGRRREYTGIVKSNKMQKTITVEVNRLTRHQRYGKFIHSFTTFKVHDEKNEAGLGDRVLIFETRPISKSKRWKLASIVEKAPKEEAVEV